VSGGREALDAFIAGVESLATLNEEVAKAAETPVADVVRATAAKASTPDGEAWAPRSGGGKALAGAAAAITSSVRGNRITVSIGPPYVYHNWGSGGSSTTKAAKRARSKATAARAASGTRSKFHAPKRQIIPDAAEPIPADINAAIKATAERVFRKAVG
jgi:hypothetical protein